MTSTRRWLEERRERLVRLELGSGLFLTLGVVLVLFAGGTGVTAFAAFLRSLTPEHTSRVLLFYGARTQDLFVYGPLVRARARDVPLLTCALVCEETHGRLQVDAAWPAIATLRHPVFYLSGPPPMLDALSGQLREHGVSMEAIRTDAWE